jgi:secondary thiamine-phosphate synthase enzyme
VIHQEEFETQATTELVDVTERVRTVVRESGVREGLCIVYSPHTTAGITLNAVSDPATAQDILYEFDQLVPIRATHRHTLDTPADAAGHVKLVLVGNSVNIPIVDGDLYLGHSQAVLFFEFDGPRRRAVQVQIIGDHHGQHG